MVFSIFIKNLAHSGDPDLTSRSAASDQGLQSLPMSKKRTLGLNLAPPRVNELYAHQRRACDIQNYHRVIVEITACRPMEVLHGKFM